MSKLKRMRLVKMIKIANIKGINICPTSAMHSFVEVLFLKPSSFSESLFDPLSKTLSDPFPLILFPRFNPWPKWVWPSVATSCSLSHSNSYELIIVVCLIYFQYRIQEILIDFGYSNGLLQIFSSFPNCSFIDLNLLWFSGSKEF